MECGYADMEPEMWICGYEEKPLCADPPDVDMKTEPPNSTETRIVDMKIDPTKRSRGEIVDMKNNLLRCDNPQPRLQGDGQTLCFSVYTTIVLHSSGP